MQGYKWRIYADNNIEKEIVRHLRGSGMDVLWISEEPELKRQIDDAFHYQRARALKRYLLTHDDDFWNDENFPLKSSPGVMILAVEDVETAKRLPRLFKRLMTAYNPLAKPLYLDEIKIRLSGESITIKMVDHDSQKKTIQTWAWSDLL